MNSKAKIAIAVVLLVVAVGAIAYYLMSSRTTVDPLMNRGAGDDAPTNVDPNG